MDRVVKSVFQRFLSTGNGGLHIMGCVKKCKSGDLYTIGKVLKSESETEVCIQ